MTKTPSKWLILLTVVSGTFIGALNGSIVNVSVPALMRALGAEIHEVEWVITAYMIAFAVMMPLTHWLKERLSYRTLFVLSLGVFALGSLLCGISGSLPLLVASRVVQAIGGGLIWPLSMAIVTDVFPVSERGRAFGIWGFGVVVGPAFGPTLGGYLTETLSWRWIFLINIPLAIGAMIMGWRYLHRKKLEVTHYQGFDFAGFVWITAMIVALLYSLTTMAAHGVGARGLAMLALSAAFGFLFVRAESKAKSPLLDLSLAGNRVFMSCITITLVRSAALFGGLFLLPLVLQDHMHLSETQSGLIMLPGALILGFMMPVTGVWSDKGHAYSLTFWGLVILAASFLVFVGVDPGTSQGAMVAIQLVRGVGLGLMLTPLSAVTMGCVRPQQVAMASAISSLAQQVGGSLGIALLVLLKALFVKIAPALGRTAASAEFLSLQACFVFAGAVVLVSLVPAANLRPARVQGT